MNFGELKTYVQDVLGRSDIPMAAYVAAQDDWARKLRLQDDEATATLVSPYTLGADVLQLREVRHDNIRLQVVPALPDYAYTGTPQQYTISDGKISVWPTSTADLTIVYVSKAIPLVNAIDTNTVLTKYEQVAIYGALYHTSVMLRDAEGMQAFGQVYATAISDAIKADNRARFHGGQMTPTPRDAA